MDKSKPLPWLVAVAWFVVGGLPRDASAQLPTAPSQNLTAEPPILPSSAIKGPFPSGLTIDSLPSTVSPAIERFMRQGGRDLPSPGPILPPSQGRRVPPPNATASTGRAIEDLPQALPPPAPSTSSPGRPPGSGLVSAGPPPLSGNIKLKEVPFDPADVRFPINLATALRLSDARPLVVAAAQASAWIAEADLTRAKVLWIPTAMFGANFTRHDGGGPDFNKGIMTAPSVNYFMAGVGANLNINLTDAIYEPLVARRMLNSAHWDVQSAKNDALMQTADAYFRVHQFRGIYAGALYNVEMGRVLVVRIADLSGELVSKVEVDRARNFLADLEQRAVQARQEWRVASADLTQVLRLDPRAVVQPLEHDHSQVSLIDPGRTLDDLMPIALANRPEIASRRALVQAAEGRVRREKNRPLLPSIMVNGFQTPQMYLQAGIFGIGPNSSLNQFTGREDVSLQAIWQLEGLGFGNKARIKAQRGQESRAIIELRNAQDMVVADVTRAQARVQSAAARILQADRALRTGIITFNGHLEGLEQTRRLGNVLVLTFRPQEAVYSLDLLSTAFREYFTTVAEYNRAQFDLFHAVGYPARELASLRPPGQAIPADTRRPGYLPPVGDGPPPATR
ncbi:TolC family protein (plasmid) [Tundrisphaera lichenicola]|uniref:TolC family protein n=1 Tax=Tundrisphaera lichenicola TaxID=2029860 RepID=UPI003EB8F289